MHWSKLKLLFLIELRTLFASRAFWILLLISSPLTGYSFMTAIDLYNQSSRAALTSPQLATGLNPFDGIIVPTLGGLYLVLTLLFPFLAIRMLSTDKASGAFRILLQLPSSAVDLIASKTLVLACALLVVEIPGILAIVLWRVSGGHVYVPEVFSILLGHALYGLIIGAISLFAAAITGSASTAAIVALGFTLGSWVLDFAALGSNAFVRGIARLSLTAALKPFEQGLLVGATIVGGSTAILMFLVLTTVWWHPGRLMWEKSYASTAIVIAWIFIVVFARYTGSADFTEDRRHSLAPAVVTALRQIQKPIRITVYLGSEDPRLLDFSQSVLAKLRRALPKTKVDFPLGRGGGFLGSTQEDKYGLIIYSVGTKEAQSRSTSPEEILSLLWELAGIDPPIQQSESPYRGYPHIIHSSRLSEICFYLALPSISLLGLVHSMRS